MPKNSGICGTAVIGWKPYVWDHLIRDFIKYRIILLQAHHLIQAHQKMELTYLVIWNHRNMDSFHHFQSKVGPEFDVSLYNYKCINISS